MQCTIEKDVNVFLQSYESWLREKLEENSRLLALLYKAQRENYDVHCMAVLDAGGRPVMAALQMPPNNLAVTGASVAGAAEFLAEQFLAFGVPLTGLGGPVAETQTIAALHRQRLGASLVQSHDDVVYAVTEVCMPQALQGSFRPAQPKDLAQTAKWSSAFSEEALAPIDHVTYEAAREENALRIAAGDIALWEAAGTPVAMMEYTVAGDVAHITLVYTPPERRGKGYAKALVATVTQRLLGEGCTTCCLYAEAGNAAANAVYRAIGYREVMRASYYVPAGF